VGYGGYGLCYVYGWCLHWFWVGRGLVGVGLLCFYVGCGLWVLGFLILVGFGFDRVYVLLLVLLLFVVIGWEGCVAIGLVYSWCLLFCWGVGWYDWVWLCGLVVTCLFVSLVGVLYVCWGYYLGV